MHMRKYACFLFLFLLLLSGCSFSSETLLALPRTETNAKLLSEQAFDLLSGRATYEVPDTGDMSGSALDIDLNGDGVSETISCLMKKSGAASHPCIEIYGYPDGEPILIAELEGDGDHIDALYFPVLDEAGTTGIVVGWGLADSSLHGMTVCVFLENQLETLYSGAYQFLSVADMDRDGFDEMVFTANMPGTDGYQALMLDYIAGDLRVSDAVPLSQGIVLQHVSTANVGFDRVALLCEGYVERYGYVTDVILCSASGSLSNIYRTELSGVSEVTARDYPIWCADANNDGIVEFPILREVSASFQDHSEKMTLIDWARCEENAEPTVLYTTYFNMREGWSMRLPDALNRNVLPVQSIEDDGISATLFYFLSGEGERGFPLWEIYALSGEQAEENEQALSLQRLTVANGTIYAIKVYHLLDGSFYTEDSLQTLFSVLPSVTFTAHAVSN